MPETSYGTPAMLSVEPRTALLDSTDLLAHRLGVPPISRQQAHEQFAVQLGAGELTELRCTELLARAVVRLCEEVDTVRVELAALSGKPGRP